MLFVSARGAGVSGALCGSMPGLEGSQSLRRASSIRRTFTAVKRKNVCLQVKFTVVSINHLSVPICINSDLDFCFYQRNFEFFSDRS